MTLTGGIWKNIIGYDGHYTVSDYGEVYSLKTKKTLKWAKNTCGYKMHTLTKNGKTKSFTTHVLVARAFLDSSYTDMGLQVNHKDGNKMNANLNNLEICTRSENMKHAYKTGLSRPRDMRGEKHHLHKISQLEVDRIRLLPAGTKWKKESDKIGITYRQLIRIRKGESWKN